MAAAIAVGFGLDPHDDPHARAFTLHRVVLRRVERDDARGDVTLAAHQRNRSVPAAAQRRGTALLAQLDAAPQCLPLEGGEIAGLLEDEVPRCGDGLFRREFHDAASICLAGRLFARRPGSRVNRAAPQASSTSDAGQWSP
ncbi:hypothetical protein [Limimaricola cinnabarinus]|uniref:hypothetical protein n=1 Tax=Limimaricola cinnabarinus TaxID=1125964 RepID=UPI0010397472|nr:hypothetical protein [Limimaricola cinnabarinus]